MTKIELAAHHGESSMAEAVTLCAEMQREAHELGLLCFAGGGGAASLALTAAIDPTTLCALGGAAVYLFMVGGLISSRVLRREPFPATWNIPASLLDFCGSDEELLSGELRNLGARIERADGILARRAARLNRLRLAVAATPIAALFSALAGWVAGF